jgi:hypothetical protein
VKSFQPEKIVPPNATKPIIIRKSVIGIPIKVRYSFHNKLGSHNKFSIHTTEQIPPIKA